MHILSNVFVQTIQINRITTPMSFLWLNETEYQNYVARKNISESIEISQPKNATRQDNTSNKARGELRVFLSRRSPSLMHKQSASTRSNIRIHYLISARRAPRCLIRLGFRTLCCSCRPARHCSLTLRRLAILARKFIPARARDAEKCVYFLVNPLAQVN